jgi:hypothetical protein
MPSSLKTKCISTEPESPLQFGRVEGRQVVAEFNGGHISSDGGLLLIRQVDQQYRLSEQIAACFRDHRDPSRVEHSIQEMVAQRLYGLVQGYEDLNDHDSLRDDVMLGVAVGKLARRRGEGSPLAGKSTLNRLEKSYRRDESDAVNERYVKTEVDPRQLEQVLMSFFFAQHPIPPKQMVLDLDVTDDETHGEQEGAEFNGYYQSTCYTPLYLFCGRDLLVARLRPANVDPAAGALEELQRVIAAIQARWPAVKIWVRGDSAYSRDDIMSWCEATPNVDYLFAQGRNAVLVRRSTRWSEAALKDYAQRRQKAQDALTAEIGEEPDSQDLDRLVPDTVYYGCFTYQTEDSWSRSRRVICKVTAGPKGVRHHFVVTSLRAQQMSSQRLHTEGYCPRGEMENRLKEQQLDLFSDRTSNHYFDDNQLRLWFSAFAYGLLNALRQQVLQHTELANARVGTIRTHLLKLGTLIRVSVRRIHLAFHSSFPRRDLFHLAYQRLFALADSS